MFLFLAVGTALASSPSLSLTDTHIDPLVHRLQLTETASDASASHFPLFSQGGEDGPLSMTIDNNGSIDVVQGEYTGLTPRQFAKTIGDGDTLRRHNRVTTGAALGVLGMGTLSVAGGAAVGLGTIGGLFYLTAAFFGEAPDGGGILLALIGGGAVVGAIGTYGVIAIGGVYLLKSRDFNHWYSESEAQEWIDGYNTRRESSLSIRPVLTPNGVGLAGTF
jgi:hypothetical protein